MYKGLTGSILNKILFDGIDLRIIKNSFIKGCDTEFDVLIVEGDGDKLPYQESYIYPADQIIAIISVKKKIYSSDLKDGFANLQFIVDSYKDYKMKDYQINLLRDSFKIICQKVINEKGLTDNEKLILYTLRIESCMPISILW